MSHVIGWDIGGVNTKVARVAGGVVRAACGRPYELQRDPAALVPLLRELAGEVGGGAASAHAVTMTAELSQMFRTKRAGVAFVLAAIEAAFGAAVVRVYAVDGRFLTIGEARQEPLAVAAANWAATARAIAAHHPESLLVDVGTTTTDIIPIVGGSVAAVGRTDPERLASGELVYSGALRTPAEAIASHVMIAGTLTGVSAEGFAIAGDVHLWRGDLDPADYTCPTPDGRPATRESAGVRLARVICADRDLLDDAAVSGIAAALAEAQVARVAAAMARVRARHPSLSTVVVTGLGAFLAAAAALEAGMPIDPLAAELGEPASRCAPAVSVALLLEQVLAEEGRVEGPTAGITEGVPPTSPFLAEVRLHSPHRSSAADRGPRESFLSLRSVRLEADLPPSGFEAGMVGTVVKLGGGLLAHPGHFDRALRAIAAAARDRALLVVPGGGPFADVVRDVDRRYGLADAAAHWMAVLAMDQYAHLVAARLTGARLVEDPAGITPAIAAGRVPVLAPSRWLRAADPLPHGWDVTSDSLAAWIAGAVGARLLVLIKPPGATGELVDPYFAHALPEGITSVIVAADRVDEVRW
ncbi:MAG: hydantoinase/oxoprolinase family protein [Acidobacteriota bacterium]